MNSFLKVFFFFFFSCNQLYCIDFNLRVASNVINVLFLLRALKCQWTEHVIHPQIDLLRVQMFATTRLSVCGWSLFWGSVVCKTSIFANFKQLYRNVGLTIIVKVTSKYSMLFHRMEFWLIPETSANKCDITRAASVAGNGSVGRKHRHVGQ